MGKDIPGRCIDIRRREPLENIFKDLLLKYAEYLNRVAVLYTIRFRQPKIETEEVERQIIKAIGYIPKEEIIICGFSNVIFDSAYEIMMKFGVYLRVGVTKQMIPKTQGKAYEIKYYEKIGTSTIPRYYHLLDCEFVSDYFAVRRDRARQGIFSLDYYTLHGFSLKDLINLKYKT
jgi:hypothetical protein